MQADRSCASLWSSQFFEWETKKFQSMKNQQVLKIGIFCAYTPQLNHLRWRNSLPILLDSLAGFPIFKLYALVALFTFDNHNLPYLFRAHPAAGKLPLGHHLAQGVGVLVGQGNLVELVVADDMGGFAFG